MLHTFVATTVGIVTAYVIASVVLGLGAQITPLQPNDTIKPVSLDKLFENMGFSEFLPILAAILFSALGGALIVTWIAPSSAPIPALIVGTGVFSLSVYFLYFVSFPLWMTVAVIALPLPIAWLTSRIAGAC